MIGFLRKEGLRIYLGLVLISHKKSGAMRLNNFSVPYLNTSNTRILVRGGGAGEGQQMYESEKVKTGIYLLSLFL